ncbi:hypothetical protein [Streptomyces sp. NPDC052496]|uniref:hypothetical protein n=1 Tax=Streptomyces sp. NPDC052496 TaxID=3154951 RepID=UPI0034424D75
MHSMLMSLAATGAVALIVVAVVLAVARDLENARRRRERGRVRQCGDHGSARAGQEVSEQP